MGLRFALPVALLVLGCAAPADAPRVALAGDSVLAWNEGGVARELAAEGHAEVIDVSRSGAWVGFPDLGGPLMRFSIMAQVPKERFDWVVVNGGANDLAYLCGCRRCAEETDRLVSRDGSRGALPATWAAIHARTGARVLILGYYEDVRATRLTGCRDALAAIDARAARFAARTPWAAFVDSDEVMTAELLDADRLHPGPGGSAAIARLIAGVIAR